MPCCPRSVDATWGRTNLRSSFTFVYRPGQSWLFVLFSLFCPPTSKGHIFSTARPIWVNFMSNQRVFRALRGNRAILEEWTKKEGAFLPHVGPFRAKNPGMALLVTWGTGLKGTRFVFTCCPRLVDATWRRTNLRSSLPSSIAQAKSAVCAYFRCFALQLQKAISFQPLGRFG